MFRRHALEGEKHCFNDGCEAVGHLKDFKGARRANMSGTAGARVRNRTEPRLGQGDVQHNETMVRIIHRGVFAPAQAKDVLPQLVSLYVHAGGDHRLKSQRARTMRFDPGTSRRTARSKWHIRKL